MAFRSVSTCLRLAPTNPKRVINQQNKHQACLALFCTHQVFWTPYLTGMHNKHKQQHGHLQKIMIFSYSWIRGSARIKKNNFFKFRWKWNYKKSIYLNWIWLWQKSPPLMQTNTDVPEGYCQQQVQSNHLINIKPTIFRLGCKLKCQIQV